MGPASWSCALCTPRRAPRLVPLPHCELRTMTELLPLMSYCLVMSATPGPNNVMLATTGANFGGRGALPAIMGIQAGLFVQTMLMCVGLGSVFVAYPVAQQALRIAGSLYLVFLAWKLSGVSVIGALVGAPCNAMWALFGVSIRRFLQDPRKQRLFNLAMAAILLVLAVM